MPAPQALSRPLALPPPGPGPGTSLSAEVAHDLATLPPGGTTTVVVTLRARAPLSALPQAPRRARLEAVVRTLRSTSMRTQTSIRSRLGALAAQGHVRRVTPLWVTNGLSITASADVIREMATRPDVQSVTPDAITIVPTAAPAEPNVAQLGAPLLWDSGVTGAGVVVATLDSGVDAAHPDLGPRWRGGTNSWYDPFGQHPTTPTDRSGHGTATMGLIVGGDSGGTSIGVAPGARWIAARIFNDSGVSSATAVHLAFQWLLDPDGNPGTDDAPQVVNGSWSIGSVPGCDLSFEPDVRALGTAGILPVFAAGNFGPGPSTSVSPANYPESLAVGAVDALGVAYPASSSGPSTCGGRTGPYPDVVAPGVGVTTSDRFGLFQTVSGTSVAAPQVSGALALLQGAYPSLSVQRQRAALASSAIGLGPDGSDDRYGAGRVDASAALAWLRSSHPRHRRLVSSFRDLDHSAGDTDDVCRHGYSPAGWGSSGAASTRRTRPGDDRRGRSRRPWRSTESWASPCPVAPARAAPPATTPSLSPPQAAIPLASTVSTVLT